MKLEATSTADVTERARLKDGATMALNIGHLRKFLDLVELTDIPDSAPVKLTEQRQGTNPWITIEISAWRSQSAVTDLQDPVPS